MYKLAEQIKSTALHLAAANNKSNVVRHLCVNPAVDIDAAEEVLLVISVPEYCVLCRICLSLFFFSQNGHTALYIAAERGHLCTIRELLRAGADVNKLNKV